MSAQDPRPTPLESEPDPEFLAHLEWQVRTAARRADRFARPVSPLRWRIARAAAVVVLALGAGAGGVFAAQHLQQSREARLRVVQWRVHCELAAARLRVAIEDSLELRAQFEAGVVATAEYAAADRERQRAEQAKARLENEAEEVLETGREPSDRISAPLLGGRDFVRERLEIAATDASDDLQAAQTLKHAAEQRFASGATSDSEVREASQQLGVALGRQRLIERRLALRAAYLAGSKSALQAELADLRLAAECSLAAQRESLEAAREELQSAQSLASAGVLSHRDLRSAQQRLSECETASRLAELEVELLARQSADPPVPESKR